MKYDSDGGAFMKSVHKMQRDPGDETSRNSAVPMMSSTRFVRVPGLKEVVWNWSPTTLGQDTSASSIATKAAELVNGERAQQHGGKADNFGRIATMWNAWLAIRREPGLPLDAHDVGQMLSLMKKARTQSGAYNADDAVDDVGYSACAGEIAGGMQ